MAMLLSFKVVLKLRVIEQDKGREYERKQNRGNSEIWKCILITETADEVNAGQTQEIQQCLSSDRFSDGSDLLCTSQ